MGRLARADRGGSIAGMSPSSRWLKQAMAKVAACLLVLACAGPRPKPAAPERPLFDIQVSFWVNLHQRLYAESGTRPPRDALHGPAWDRAVESYRQRFPDRGLLTLLENEELIRLSRQDEVPADLAEAAAFYRATQWPIDERAD